MILANDVAIIILNYNNANDTINCIRSLQGLNSNPGAIVIVDNNSNKEDILKIKKFLGNTEYICIDNNQLLKNQIRNKKIFLLLLDSNDGYSKGNNLGIKFIQKIKKIKAYWILNNDTIVDKKSLDALCAKINNEDIPSIIGSSVVNMHDMTTLQCASGYSSHLKIAFDKPILSGKNISEISNIDDKIIEKKISYIIGASMFIHSDVLKIGLFREDFFLYAEEVEYCIRAKRQGIHLLWAKDSIVYHKGGGTTKTSSGLYYFPKWVDYLMIRNKTRIIAEYYPLLLSFCWIYGFVLILRRVVRRRPIRPLLLYKAIWDGTIRRMGKPNKDYFY